MPGESDALKGFQSLICYKQARNLRNMISKLSAKFPSKENYLLRSQIVDSSRSVASNIAEGYGRFTYNDTKRFFVIARGSVTETMEHLSVALDEEYISEDDYEKGDALCTNLLKLINGYIIYLEKSNNNLKK